MKKIILILCMFLVVGCSNKIKVVRDNSRYQEQFIESYPTYTYGLPIGWSYDIVETEDGYKVDLVKGYVLKNGEMYKNDEFTIRYDIGYVENSHRENRRTYYYVSNDKETIIHENEGFIDYNNAKFPRVHTLTDKVYFSYYTDDYFIFNEVKDGKLIEIDKMPLVDGEFKFDSIVTRYDEKYYIYKAHKVTKYVFEDNTYEFAYNDRIIVLKDYILYSTMFANELKGSYLINKNTSEVKELNNAIYIIIDDFYTYDYRMSDNSFVFLERIDNKYNYSYAEIIDNEMKIVEIPFDKNQVQWTHKLSENQIEVVIDKSYNDSNMDYYLITIK